MTTFDLSGKELRVGTTINNNPTVQDPVQLDLRLGLPLCRLGPGANADRGAGDIDGRAELDRLHGVCLVHRSLYLEGGIYTTGPPGR